MRRTGKAMIGFIPAMLCLLLEAGSATVFSACGIKEDGGWMRCHSSQTAVELCALALCAVLIVRALLRLRTPRIILGGVGIIASAVIFLLPGQLMPLCMMHTMRCYTLFQPFVRIMAVLIGLTCVAAAIRLFKEREG